MRFLAFVAGARGCGRRRRIGLELRAPLPARARPGRPSPHPKPPAPRARRAHRPAGKARELPASGPRRPAVRAPAWRLGETPAPRVRPGVLGRARRRRELLDAVAQLGEHVGVVRVLPLAPARVERARRAARAQPADRLGGRAARCSRVMYLREQKEKYSTSPPLRRRPRRARARARARCISGSHAGSARRRMRYLFSRSATCSRSSRAHLLRRRAHRLELLLLAAELGERVARVLALLLVDRALELGEPRARLGVRRAPLGFLRLDRAQLVVVGRRGEEYVERRARRSPARGLGLVAFRLARREPLLLQLGQQPRRRLCRRSTRRVWQRDYTCARGRRRRLALGCALGRALRRALGRALWRAFRAAASMTAPASAATGVSDFFAKSEPKPPGFLPPNNEAAAGRSTRGGAPRQSKGGRNSSDVGLLDRGFDARQRLRSCCRRTPAPPRSRPSRRVPRGLCCRRRTRRRRHPPPSRAVIRRSSTRASRAPRRARRRRCRRLVVDLERGRRVVLRAQQARTRAQRLHELGVELLDLLARARARARRVRARALPRACAARPQPRGALVLLLLLLEPPRLVFGRLSRTPPLGVGQLRGAAVRLLRVNRLILDLVAQSVDLVGARAGGAPCASRARRLWPVARRLAAPPTLERVRVGERAGAVAARDGGERRLARLQRSAERVARLVRAASALELRNLVLDAPRADRTARAARRVRAPRRRAVGARARCSPAPAPPRSPRWPS